MARRFALAVLLFAQVAATASAQQLQRLHVRSFTLSAPRHVQLEQPFDLTLTVILGDRVSRLDNVFLPAFFGAEELGDVRSLSRISNGTLYRETMRLVAHASGTLDISSAYLDAIDARDGKPKRFISNALHVQAGQPAGRSLWPWLSIFSALLVAAGVTLLSAARRRRAPAKPPAVPREPEPEPVQMMPEPHESLDAALQQLRETKNRCGVMRVREALWRDLGARDGQTVGDVLALVPVPVNGVRRLLLAIEAAAFCNDDDLPRAIERVLQ